MGVMQNELKRKDMRMCVCVRVKTDAVRSFFLHSKMDVDLANSCEMIHKHRFYFRHTQLRSQVFASSTFSLCTAAAEHFQTSILSVCGWVI